MKIVQILLAAALLLTAAGTAQAALFDRGGGLIYDDDLNVTWLKDANYGAGSAYDDLASSTDGRMSWNNAVSWAANLSYYDSVRNVTYTDWRLPVNINFNSSTETAHLLNTELGGGNDWNSIIITHNANYFLFQNIQDDVYWSNTGSLPCQMFGLHYSCSAGTQHPYNEDIGLYAWAVRPGDVAAVPVPAAMWLLGSGLLGLIRVARRKAA